MITFKKTIFIKKKLISVFPLKHVITEALLFIGLSLDICVDLAPASPWISSSVHLYKWQITHV